MIHHVPQSQVAKRIAQGWVPVYPPTPSVAPVAPSSGWSGWGCVVSLIAFVAAFAIVLYAVSGLRTRAEVDPLTLIPTVVRPTAVPTPRSASATVVGGPGVYVCEACEANGGCAGFRSGARIAFGGGLTELLGWDTYTPNGEMVDISAGGPFGVDAVYRRCKKVGA